MFEDGKVYTLTRDFVLSDDAKYLKWMLGSDNLKYFEKKGYYDGWDLKFQKGDRFRKVEETENSVSLGMNRFMHIDTGILVFIKFEES